MGKTKLIMRRLIVFLLFAFQVCIVYAQSVCVYNQKQFDAIVSRINQGEELCVTLHKGRYLLKESVLANAPLSMKGKGATITCARELESRRAIRQTETHSVFKLDSPLPLYSVFYDNNKNIVSVSESVLEGSCVNYLEGEIISPKEYGEDVEILIPISKNLTHLKNKAFSFAFGYFDSGWSLVYFKLGYSDDKYFHCRTLNGCSTKNYMYDKSFYKKDVRYVIYNAEMKDDCIFYDSQYLYVPKSIKKLYIINKADDNHFVPSITFNSSVLIDGVRFEGVNGLIVNSNRFDDCVIKNCAFEKTPGNTLSINKRNHINGVAVARVVNCSFSECGILGSILYLSSDYCNNTCIDVQNCRFSRYPNGHVLYKNTGGAVRVNGDVNLLNNVVCNTCRDHLYLYGGQIHVKGNVLYNTDEFNSHKERNLSSDWGLIYCDHYYSDKQKAIDNKFHHVVIEDNLLYGAYAYGGDARGIFIDNGRGDVTCRNNIILNTQIYAIDSWHWRQNEASSVRNRYEGNLITSNYRLMTGPALSGNNKPVTKSNMMLGNQERMVGDVLEEGKDFFINIDTNLSCVKDKIYVSRDLLKIIREMPAWKSIRRNLKKNSKCNQ